MADFAAADCHGRLFASLSIDRQIDIITAPVYHPRPVRYRRPDTSRPPKASCRVSREENEAHYEKRAKDAYALDRARRAEEAAARAAAAAAAAASKASVQAHLAQQPYPPVVVAKPISWSFKKKATVEKKRM